MHRVPTLRQTPLWLATFVLFAMAGPALAQSTSKAPAEQGAIDWRKANDDVSQFKRGHADVLKWETTNDSIQNTEPVVVPDLWMKTSEAAVRQAWQARPELSRSLSKLGRDNQERIVKGHWLEIDPMARRWVDDFDTIMDVAADARKAWFTAVAANLGLKQQRDMQEASAAAAELASRMARVGNWSRMEQAQWQAKLVKMKVQTLKAGMEATQSQISLLKSVNLWGTVTHVGLPDAWPDMPEEALAEAHFQKSLTAIRKAVPGLYEGRKVTATAQLAFEIYNASYVAAQYTRDDVKLQQLINDEVVLRYNGMLLSVWDLLSQTSEQLQANVTAINARRDLLIAETDLQLVLQGGSPNNFVSLGGASGDSAAATK